MLEVTNVPGTAASTHTNTMASIGMGLGAASGVDSAGESGAAAGRENFFRSGVRDGFAGRAAAAAAAAAFSACERALLADLGLRASGFLRPMPAPAFGESSKRICALYNNARGEFQRRGGGKNRPAGTIQNRQTVA